MDNKNRKDEIFDLNAYRSQATPSSRKKTTTKKKTGKAKKEQIIRIGIASFMVCIMLACIVIGGFLVYVFNFIDGDFGVNLEELKLNCTTTVYVEDDDGGWVEYQRLYGNVNRVWVSYEKIHLHFVGFGWHADPFAYGDLQLFSVRVGKDGEARTD